MESWLNVSRLETRTTKHDIKLLQPTDNFSAIVYVLVLEIYCTLRLYVFEYVVVSFFFVSLRWKMKLDFHQCVEMEKKSVTALDVLLLLFYIFFP